MGYSRKIHTPHPKVDGKLEILAREVADCSVNLDGSGDLELGNLGGKGVLAVLVHVHVIPSEMWERSKILAIHWERGVL